MKVIRMSLLMLICILLLPSLVNASEIIVNTDALYGRIDPSTYEPTELQDSDVSGIEIFGGAIASVIQIVGTIVSVGTMMIIGIRYVVASADEKAEYRDRMIPYFIGAVLLFGASNVVNIIFKIFN